MLTKRLGLQACGGVLLAVVIIFWQIAKGVSFEVSIHPLFTYLYTYADGPVRRALIPSLLHLLGATDFNFYAAFLLGLHLASLWLLGVYLLYALGQRQGWRLGLLWLFIASAALPVLAATAGYFDATLVVMLMGVAVLLRAGRAMAAALVLALAILQHEMAFVLGLPLFVAETLLVPAHRQRSLVAGALVAVAGIIFIYVSGAVQAHTLELALQRCPTIQPVDQFNSYWWNIYCIRQQRATFASDFMPLRVILFPLYASITGIFSTLLVTAGLIMIHHSSRRIRAMLLFGLALVPYSLIMIAWDVDRIITMGAVVGWLVFDRWLEVEAPPAPSVSSQRSWLVFPVALQLLMTYPAIDVYAHWRLVSPVFSKAWLIDPRSWILPWLAFMNQPTLEVLSTCTDPRCAGSQP